MLPFAPFWPQLTFELKPVGDVFQFWKERMVVRLDGKELPVLSTKTSRMVFGAPGFVVKVERSSEYKQNLVEVLNWHRLDRRDRRHFTPSVGFGLLHFTNDAGTPMSFSIQRRLRRPLGDLDVVTANEADDLADKYDLYDMDDTQGKMLASGSWKLHDYGIVARGDDHPVLHPSGPWAKVLTMIGRKSPPPDWLIPEEVPLAA